MSTDPIQKTYRCTRCRMPITGHGLRSFWPSEAAAENETQAADFALVIPGLCEGYLMAPDDLAEVTRRLGASGGTSNELQAGLGVRSSADIDLDELRRVAEAATPGEWFVDERGGGVADIRTVNVNGDEPVAWADLGACLSADAAHIAAMDPPTTLALLAEVVALRGQIAAVRAAASRAMDLAEKPVAQLILEALDSPSKETPA